MQPKSIELLEELCHKFIDEDGKYFYKYVHYYEHWAYSDDNEDCPIALDGNFTASQLREIADTLDEVSKIECWAKQDIENGHKTSNEI